MASQTPNQENLVAKNAAYAEQFTQGHLALPPAKKYAVGKLQRLLEYLFSTLSNRLLQ
jgi:hypothetical protein